MARRRGRHVGDAAFGVEEQECVGAVLNQRAEALFARAQRFFRGPALSLPGADELMVMTTMYGLEDRLRSYELLAEAFHLTPAA